MTTSQTKSQQFGSMGDDVAYEAISARLGTACSTLVRASKSRNKVGMKQSVKLRENVGSAKYIL
jgi:hypothetical protein